MMKRSPPRYRPRPLCREPPVPRFFVSPSLGCMRHIEAGQYVSPVRMRGSTCADTTPWSSVAGPIRAVARHPAFPGVDGMADCGSAKFRRPPPLRAPCPATVPRPRHLGRPWPPAAALPGSCLPPGTALSAVLYLARWRVNKRPLAVPWRRASRAALMSWKGNSCMAGISLPAPINS